MKNVKILEKNEIEPKIVINFFKKLVLFQEGQEKKIKSENI